MQLPATIEQVQDFKGRYPRQLYLLFFTEMWERFMFYGNRALLLLFMVNHLHFDDARGNFIYGTYQSLIYAVPVFGGLLADKLLGQQRSILWGGLLMALGSFIMAIPVEASFFAGMSVIIVGNGFLKPNISTIVGSLYKAGDSRRDAGFSLFYLGINLGGAAGGFICGYIGQQVNWHLGFGIAGVFMLAGLLLFYFRRHKLGPVGLPPSAPALAVKVMPGISRENAVYLLSIAAVPLFVLLLHYYPVYSYIINPFGIVALVYVLYTAWGMSRDAFAKIVAALVLIVFSALFWAFYEQGGGSLNLFAERNVDMQLMGTQLSSAAVNNFINPALIVVLTPFFVWLWMWLARRRREPDAAVKFALGLVQLAAGFYILTAGSRLAENGMVSLLFFVLGYLLMTMGELCVSPIGLSVITKLSPPKMAGLMMGVWFLASSYGQYLAGWIGSLMAIPGEDATGARMSAAASLAIYSGVFTKIALVSAACGLVLLALVPWLKKMMRGVR